MLGKNFKWGVQEVVTLVPNVAALPYAVHALFEFKNIPFRDFKTRWQLHVKVLLEASIKVSCLDVHLMEFEVVLSCEGKDSLEG